METHYERRHVPAWAWVLIVLVSLMLITLVWWAVAQHNANQMSAVPGQEQPSATPPTTTSPGASQPGGTGAANQPSGTTTKAAVPSAFPPVILYVKPDQPQSKVVVVAPGEKTPEATSDMKKISLPSKFKYQGQSWKASDNAITRDSTDVSDTGSRIQGLEIYAAANATTPYTELYVEITPGSKTLLEYSTGK